MIEPPISFLWLVAWSLVWGLGGVWLARAVFRLQPAEYAPAGLALGFVLENWLANFLGRFLPLPVAAWLCAVLVFALGLALAWRVQRVRFSLHLGQLLALGAITTVAFMINRGMAIFDDYAHLPTVSIMAAGDIPPHFSLDPNVVYGYHHFLLLFAAQVMRVAGWPAWSAIDAARALSFGLAVMLAGLWTARLARSALVGVLGGAMLAFGSGGRWLLLLLPHRLVQWLGHNVHMLGSGAGSGPNLAEALTNAWAVEGVGPQPFPFAFANGIFPPGVVTMFSAYGLCMYIVILLLLLTFNRWQAGRWQTLVAGALSAVVFSAWGLLSEVELVILLAGWALVAGVAVFRFARPGVPSVGSPRRWRLAQVPATLWRWLAVIAAGSLLGFFAGGAWTDLIFKTARKLVTGVAEPSYQTVGFTLAAPAVVSSHLGVLSLFDPAQLLLGLFELGPLLLALPLLAGFGLRALRSQRWFEAAQAAAALISLAMLFVQFTGSTGVRNTSRLYVFMPLCLVFAAPLGWWWLERRGPALRAWAAGLGLAVMTGGLVMFGIELLAIQRPVYSYFLTSLDAQMSAAHWDRLPKDALVFDPEPARGTTVLGRFTDSGYTWFATKPEWQALYDQPDPYALQAAGFDYLYLDQAYWNGMGPEGEQRFQDACVQLLDQKTNNKDFRRLYDLSACRQAP